MTKKQLLILLLVLAIGAFFRFYLIKEMPGGLFPDEAANGLDINNIFKGHLEPFYQRGNGRESLFFYLLAASVSIFGRGAWQHHIVSAGIGVLSIFAVYLLASRLFDKKTGLLAAFLMAVNAWHIVLSRTAFRAIMSPLFIALTFYFAVRAIQAKSKTDRLWSAIFFGASLAGGLYTYINFRMMGPIILVLLVLALIADQRQKFKWVKEYWKSFVAAIISFFVVFLPMAIYWVQDPTAIAGRAGQVSIFNSDLNHGHVGALAVDVFKKTITGFFTQGDTNWRQNISGDPFLSPLISPFFGLSLIVFTILSIIFIVKAFKNKQDNSHWKYLIVTGIFWGMAVPELLTGEGIPHGLRLAGVIPAVFIMAAVGIMYVVRRFLQIPHYKMMEKAYALVAVCFFLTLMVTSYTSYFVSAYNTPENFQAFRSDLTVVSDYLNKHPDKEHNLLVLDLFSVQTVDYLTTATGNAYTIIDPANAWKINPRSGDRVIFTESTLPDSVTFTQHHRNEGHITDAINDKFGDLNLVVFQVDKDSASPSVWFNSDKSFNVINFGDRVDFQWQNQSFDPWEMKIWECKDSNCSSSFMIKDNQQNDYLQNSDYILTKGNLSDMYFRAAAYQKGQIIKDFGIVKVQKYEQK